MTIKTAIESFEQAAQEARSRDDSTMEFIALGLIDLAKSLRNELNDIKRKIDAVESKVRSIR